MAALQAAAAVCLADRANAQQSQKQDDTTVLETITVTARNIEEEAKNVPFSLSPRQGEDLRKQDIDDTQSLARGVPGFNHADSGLPFSNLVNMRGIGSSSALISPAISYYVDGVPVPARMFDMPFGAVERIEVLRGPQATHFGLNSQAGTVNIITLDPAETFGGSTGFLSGRLSGRLTDFDGDLSNVLWSAPGIVSSMDDVLRARTYGSLSGKLLFDFGDAGKLTLGANGSRDRQNPTTGVWLDDPGFPRNAYDGRIQNLVPGYTLALELFGCALTGRIDPQGQILVPGRGTGSEILALARIFPQAHRSSFLIRPQERKTSYSAAGWKAGNTRLAKQTTFAAVWLCNGTASRPSGSTRFW